MGMKPGVGVKLKEEEKPDCVWPPASEKRDERSPFHFHEQQLGGRRFGQQGRDVVELPRVKTAYA
jgi:hypothetical protein